MFYALSSRDQTSSARLGPSRTKKQIISKCNECEAVRTEPEGLILLEVDGARRGTFWPDVASCLGRQYGIYVAQSVKEQFDKSGVRYGKAFRAKSQKPFPKGLTKHPPDYFYLTGEQGAQFDFEGAEMTVESICPACGEAKRKAQTPKKRGFIKGSWNGSDIFVTDLSPSSYFCTQRIVELAREYRWTCFCFVPLNEAHDYGHQGIEYLS